MQQSRFHRFLTLAAFACATCVLVGSSSDLQAQAVIAPGTIDLLATPPELTASVDPNIVVTFDDSGSMASNFMGDNRPFDNGSWTGPWRCAGAIDPRVTSTADIRAHAMNGVYYNPNVLYTSPVKADGTAFANADQTLAAVWADGIAVNRPLSPVTPAATAFNNNPNSAAAGNDNKVTNLLGFKGTVTSSTPGSASGRSATCPASTGTTVISNCNCTNPGRNGNVCTWTATTTTDVDNRWNCGYSSYPTAFVGGEDVNAGGPYYFRLKDTVAVAVSATTGLPTAAGTTALYTAANWEAVRVPNVDATIEGVTVNQWQNFANWYAYYRTRNLMTRSALSRTFNKFSGNVRVAWQNINDGTFKLPSGSIITNLLDKAGVSCGSTSPSTSFGATAQPDCYRSAFFNWVFQTGANGSTPDRASTIRAGDFFKRGNTGNLADPYWQLADASAGTDGRELSCRQNFHMLVTDGYWNEGDPSTPSPYNTSEASITLPDGTAYSTSALQSRIFWDVDGSLYDSSLANIAFNYWAQDLRTDIPNKVKPFLPDKTIGVTGSTPVGADPLQNLEVYFNPANDPATWQHVVQFMVTLGIAGKLNFSDDIDCADANSDLCKLRKGQPNSAGITGWPRPVNNSPEAIDDTWHAAINSRGSYFSASNPGDLVTHLEAIINSVLARGASSTPVSLSLPLAAAGNTAYSAGYDSSDWSGTLIRENIDPATNQVGATAPWDAGCILTGGTFDQSARHCSQPTGGPWVAPPGYPSTARAPDSRRIFTSKRDSSGVTIGVPFRWDVTALGTELVNGLNQKPTATTLCDGTTNVAACDGFGTNRVNYLRGVRMNEATTSPHFRTRGSVLGAVINASPLYVSSPRSGFHDTYPIGSPEQVAYVADPNAGYATYQNSNRSRQPMVYVGSNDGMLHAFDASTGAESWAYVPATLIQNRRLALSTADTAGLTPGVDVKPIENDAFINGSWHTYIIGSLRLGGRGIFAMDVTNVPQGSDSEATVAGKIKWEFNSGPTRAPASVPSPDPVCAFGATSCPSLGYTYDSTNVARIKYQNKWVVLASSGYFPSLSKDAAQPDDANEPAAKHTSLLVIDLEKGTLIREIRTDIATQTRPAGFKTYGLSTPNVVDFGDDQIDDFAYAGDLAGNLWRFDLSDADPTNWKVDLMFTTYGDGGAATAGDQPIVFNPTAMADPVTKRPMIVIGTGKYLGRGDRTSAIPQQAFYGIRDFSGSGSYPIRVNQLVTQNITQGAEVNGVAQRQITGFSTPAGSVPASTPFMVLNAADGSGNPIRTRVRANGWRLPLNIAAEPGERAERRAFPLYGPNVSILYTMIPKGNDPCDPGRRFALMFVDAAGGGATTRTGVGDAGPVIGSAAPPPEPQVTREGKIIMPPIPGLSPEAMTLLNSKIESASPFMPWHRGAWKELLDLQ